MRTPDTIEAVIAEFERASAELAARTVQRLRAFCDQANPALTGAPNSAPAMTEASGGERRYTPGPLPADWRHVSKLADILGCSSDTAWRLAHDAEAQWPFGKRSRRVDMSKLQHVLPDLP